MNNNLFFFFNLSVLVCFEVQELKRFAMVPSCNLRTSDLYPDFMTV